MLTNKYLKDLHKLSGWELTAVLYYNAKLARKSEKKFSVMLPNNIKSFPAYTDEELWDILFNKSDVLAWKKFKKKSSQLNASEIKHLREDYYKKHISARITDFNKRSERGDFEGQIDQFPKPRIARSIPAKRSNGKYESVSKHIQNNQEADIVCDFWIRNFKSSAKNIAETKTCVAHTLPDEQRDALLDAGKRFKDDINNSKRFDVNKRFPKHDDTVKLLELKKAS